MGLLGVGLQKEVEGVEDCHLGNQINLHQEFVGLFRKYQAAR